MNPSLSERVQEEINSGRRSLFDDFEYEGKWWIPGSEEREVPGILRIKGSKAELSLSLEAFLWSTGKGRFPIQNEKGMQIAERVPVIHGISAVGIPFSVIGVSLASSKLNYPGYERSRYQVQSVIIGVHVDSDDFEATAIRFLYPDLIESLDLKDLEPTAEVFPGEKIIQSVRLETFTLNVVSKSVVNATKARCIVERQIWLEVRSDEPVQFSKLHKAASLFGHYLDILHGIPGSPIRAEIVASDEFSLPVFFGLEKDWGRRWKQDKFLIRLADLDSQSIQASIKALYEGSESFKSTVYLFSSVLNYPSFHNEIDFVMLCQAIESFYRSTRHRLYMPQDEYTILKDSMLELIPAGLGSSFEGKLRANINYGNELSQKDILREVLDCLPENIRELFLGDWNLVKEVIDTRNYYTHFSEELRSKKMSPVKLAGANLCLMALLNGLLLEHLGIDRETVWNQIVSLSRFKNFVYIRNGCVEEDKD